MAKASNKYIRLIKNIGMLLAGNFVSKVLSFLMVPFYTSILTTSDYGTADLISNTVLLVLPLFSVLMNEAVMRFTLDQTTDRKQVFSIAMTVSTFGYLAAMCFSPLILLSQTLRPYYWFVVMYYVVSWLYNITSCYVKGLDRLSIITSAGIIHTFVYLSLNIFFLAVVKIGIYGYLLAIILSNLAAIIFLVLVCRLYKNFVSIRSLDWKLAKAMVKYSLPLIPNYISWWINNASDKYILTFICGTAANGVYSVAYKIPTLLSSVTSIFYSAWTISSVDDFGSDESRRFYEKVYSLYSALLMVAGAGLILLTKPLASVLYAKEFYEAWKITPILVVAYIFSALAQQVGSVFSASKRTKRLFYASMTGAGVNTILNLALIPMLQGVGAASATVIGYITIWALNMYNGNKILKMDYNLSRIIPCTLVLIFEIIVVSLQIKYWYVYAGLAVMIVIAVNRKELFGVLVVLKSKLSRRKDAF